MFFLLFVCFLLASTDLLVDALWVLPDFIAKSDQQPLFVFVESLSHELQAFRYRLVMRVKANNTGVRVRQVAAYSVHHSDVNLRRKLLITDQNRQDFKH